MKASTEAQDTLYRVDLKYAGTPFQGWQSQPDGSGVQDHLEKALGVMLRHPLRVTGASRTDTGVHAEHQVATFRTAVPYDEYKWIRSLQGLMPDAVGVTGVKPVDPSFHPIYASQGKAYVYRIWKGPTRHPLLAPFCWEVPPSLDVARMRGEAQALLGTHDFSSFCAVDSSAKTRVRTVNEISFFEAGPLVEVWVIGEGFLKQMIRIMIGTLAAVGHGKLAPGSVARILAAKDRTAAGMTAPGQGLCLARIFYEKRQTAAELRDEAAAACGFFA